MVSIKKDTLEEMDEIAKEVVKKPKSKKERVVCPQCEGSGLETEDKACPRCKGTGNK